jgi:hypothetical protein
MKVRTSKERTILKGGLGFNAYGSRNGNAEAGSGSTRGLKGLRGLVGWNPSMLGSWLLYFESLCVTLTHLSAQDDLHHMHRQRVEPEISILYIFSCRLTQKGAGPTHGANVAQLLQLCLCGGRNKR